MLWTLLAVILILWLLGMLGSVGGSLIHLLLVVALVVLIVQLLTGRRTVETMLLIREIDEYERWTWHLLDPKTDVEIRLRSLEQERTAVAVTTSRGSASPAVKRLYDLVQTAASF